MVTPIPHRGEIWICNLGDPIGTRPVVIISADPLNEVRAKVILAVGTTKQRKIATEIPIGAEEGLSKEGVISASDLLTIHKEFLVRKVGELNQEKLIQLDHALGLALNL
jgi:mRNA interferase MazF